MIENNMIRNLHDDPIMNPEETEDCPDCGGSGRILKRARIGLRNIESEFTCSYRDCFTCDGTGRVIKKPFVIDEDD